MRKSRVIGIQETGEELVCYTGTRKACDKWIRDNRENYPEWRGMYVEDMVTLDDIYNEMYPDNEY